MDSRRGRPRCGRRSAARPADGLSAVAAAVVSAASDATGYGLLLAATDREDVVAAGLYTNGGTDVIWRCLQITRSLAGIVSEEKVPRKV